MMEEHTHTPRTEAALGAAEFTSVCRLLPAASASAGKAAVTLELHMAWQMLLCQPRTQRRSGVCNGLSGTVESWLQSQPRALSLNCYSNWNWCFLCGNKNWFLFQCRENKSTGQSTPHLQPKQFGRRKGRIAVNSRTDWAPSWVPGDPVSWNQEQKEKPREWGRQKWERK